MNGSDDPFDLSGQENAKLAQRDKSKRETETEAEDLKWIMSNKRGRRFIWGMLDRAGIYRSSFTGNSTTFFNEGQRNIGLQLVGMIHEFCSDQYAVMVKEFKNARNSDDNSRK